MVPLIIIVVAVASAVASLVCMWSRQTHIRNRDLKESLLDQEDAKQAGTTLYHQTSEQFAERILSTGFSLGTRGLAGGGIYFTTTKEHTEHKAKARGVILEAKVNLGRIHTLEASGDKSMTGEELNRMGFDSVCIARAVKSGHEYVVYSPDQVLSVKRIA